MEYFGIISFVFMMCMLGLPSKLKALERRVRCMEKQQRRERGDSEMSKLIAGLVGQDCLLELESEPDVRGHILEVDDDWIKYSYKDKKGAEVVKIIRIDAVESVQLL